jgi:Mg-chelatase subunit ChlD
LELALGKGEGWDIAIRYHQLKAKAALRNLVPEFRRISAEAVLAKARAVLGSVVRPLDRRTAPWPEVPGDVAAELNIEETIENQPYRKLCPEDLFMDYEQRRRQPVVIAVDTSLSMTGEKLALTAVALAVVLLEFADDSVGIVAFENEATILKYPDERVSVIEFVERFLDVPAQGYTHLEDGLRVSLKLLKNISHAGGRRPSAILLTDGKYTAGADPAYLAQRFHRLLVMKMGYDRASMPLCRELAVKGHGSVREVRTDTELPTAMYAVVKDLLRFGF